MKRHLLSGLFVLAIAVLPAVALAQDVQNSAGVPAGGNTTGFPAGGSTVGFPAGGSTNTGCTGTNCYYTVQNPLGASSFCGLIKNLLQAAIAIGIPIAVLFIVYAGFKFVLARGNAEKLKEARTNFLWTIIGIAIFLGAWLLASVVANTVNSLGGSQNIISCN